MTVKLHALPLGSTYTGRGVTTLCRPDGVKGQWFACTDEVARVTCKACLRVMSRVVTRAARRVMHTHRRAFEALARK